MPIGSKEPPQDHEESAIEEVEAETPCGLGTTLSRIREFLALSRIVVNFREDDSRTRERTLGNNLSWLRRFAVTLLKRHPDKDSLRGKMMSCMLNTDYLTQVLSI